MKRDASLYALGLLLALLLAAGCSRPPRDAQTLSDVQRQIYSDPSIHSRRISVQSRHGIVTLNGSVTSAPQRFAAAADAATVEGVKTVVNNLQVVAAQAQASASQASSPAPATLIGRAPSEPAIQPAAPTEQRVNLAGASAAKPMPHSRTSEASAGRIRTKRSEVKKSGVPLAAANTTAGTALPYSVSAPPSSPVGASDTPAHPLMPASTPQPSPTAVPVSASLPAVKPPAAPVPATPPLTAALPPAPPKPVNIPSGTTIAVRLLDRIDTATSHAGDSFRATLNAPLVDESGATVVPQGYEVTGKIVHVKSAGRFAGSSELALELTQLSVDGRQYNLQTNQYTRQGKSRGKSTAEKVGGGAALGAVLGGIFGGAKGAAIGATLGAGAGTGVSATGKGQQIVLRPETALNFELQSTLSVVPTTQSPHGTRREQRASSAGRAGDNSAAAEDGPPVLKRRSQ